MSTTIKNVAIAGASGSLGVPITKALVDAGFTVTALTRPDSKSTFPNGVKVAQVDYSSKDSLTSALGGQDAIISTLATTAAGNQNVLVEAAIAAGVKRIIPSEFGSDTFNPRARALPVYKDKVEVGDLVERLCDESGGKTTYTFVLNSAFLDWGIEKQFLIDTKEKKYEFLDGGDTYFTTNPLPFIARGVVAILQRPEATANKTIRLQGARLTQREFLTIVQRATGTKPEEWTVTERKSQDVENGAWETLKSGPANPMEWVLPMLMLAVHADGFGGDFGEAGRKDTELLGLKALSDAEIEEVIKGAL